MLLLICISSNDSVPVFNISLETWHTSKMLLQVTAFSFLRSEGYSPNLICPLTASWFFSNTVQVFTCHCLTSNDKKNPKDLTHPTSINSQMWCIPVGTLPVGTQLCINFFVANCQAFQENFSFFCLYSRQLWHLLLTIFRVFKGISRLDYKNSPYGKKNEWQIQWGAQKRLYKY